jgi:hypothetical protein
MRSSIGLNDSSYPTQLLKLKRAAGLYKRVPTCASWTLKAHDMHIKNYQVYMDFMLILYIYIYIYIYILWVLHM